MIGYFLLSKWRLTQVAIVWLLAASLFFYGHWKVSYLLQLLISIAGNFGCGRAISFAQPRSTIAKILLCLGVCFNLGILGYYKYATFFVESINHFFSDRLPVPSIILPLAISFYSFTQIAYLVDSYRGETKHFSYNFTFYSLFVVFFPQLIAGPILRHNELIPQFDRLRNFAFSHKNMAMGVTLFTLGLAKKVLIADNLSPWVAPVFDHASDVGFLEAWVGALSYTLQLYFDFSGYSDMAIGLGQMFNLQLPINFNSPYKATSIIDFWRRWHITLSRFLRDYLYIPLGGNRLGEERRYINLMITMLLGGLWHGAGWTYVVWGGMHGVFLVINHGWRKLNISLPKVLGWAITFLSIIISWVIFRAHTLNDGIEISQAMLGMKGVTLLNEFQQFLSWLTILGVKFESWQEFDYLPLNHKQSLLTLILLLLGAVFLPNTQQIMQNFKPTLWRIALISGTAVFSLLSLNQVSEFLYFQF